MSPLQEYRAPFEESEVGLFDHHLEMWAEILEIIKYLATHHFTMAMTENLTDNGTSAEEPVTADGCTVCIGYDLLQSQVLQTPLLSYIKHSHKILTLIKFI